MLNITFYGDERTVIGDKTGVVGQLIVSGRSDLSDGSVRVDADLTFEESVFEKVQLEEPSKKRTKRTKEA